jgi:SAM-dependent methyltransferase
MSKGGENSIAVYPNPIRVMDRMTVVAATVSWTSTRPAVEVRVGAPDGPLLSTTSPSGQATTGKWVYDGMTFYLQDVTGGLPLNSVNTLASVTVRMTTARTLRDIFLGRLTRLLSRLKYHYIVRPWFSLKGKRQYDPPMGLVRFGDFRRVEPMSRVWGTDRGRPIDRYYVENFLLSHASDIRGRVLSIGDDFYTRRFGGQRLTQIDVLDTVPGNPAATVVADLTAAEHIPSDSYECIILTQTLQLIYDVRAAIRTLYRILKPGGVLLATFPGISQTADKDWAEKWFWNFTPVSAHRLFGETFPPQNIEMEAFGNVLVAISFLHGLSVEEMRQEELDFRDPGYDVTIAIRAVKP